MKFFDRETLCNSHVPFFFVVLGVTTVGYRGKKLLKEKNPLTLSVLDSLQEGV